MQGLNLDSKYLKMNLLSNLRKLLLPEQACLTCLFFVFGFFLKYLNLKTPLCTGINNRVDVKFKCFRNMQIIIFFHMKACVEASKLNIDI